MQRLPAVLLAAGVLAVWQAASMAAAVPHIFPAPTDILVRLFELREVLLLHHLPQTLLTIVAGWLLSVTIGVLLALLMHASAHADAMLHPVLTVTQTIPVMCISPLFVLWLGYTISARLLAVVLSTFFTITLNTREGLRRTDPQKIQLLHSYGASRREIFFLAEVPYALPRFLTSLKMTFPWAVVDAAAAEWLGANSGLGYFSRRMISRMDGAAVFAPVVLLCLLAVAGMALLRFADQKLCPYRAEL